MIDTLAPAQRMLDAIVAHFEAQGWDLPPRRYLCAGDPLTAAMDDESLLVGLDRVMPGGSTGGRGAGAISRGVGAIEPPRAQYTARLARCVIGLSNEAQYPPAEALHADGLKHLVDPGRLLMALFAWRESEPLSTSPNATVLIGQVEMIRSEGYMAGCYTTVSITPIQ